MCVSQLCKWTFSVLVTVTDVLCPALLGTGCSSCSQHYEIVLIAGHRTVATRFAYVAINITSNGAFANNTDKGNM